MTNKSFLPSIACAALCALVFSNCSTIQMYRKNPTEWTKQKNVPKSDNNGIFGFFKKSKKEAAVADSPTLATKPTSTTTSRSSARANQANTRPNAPVRRTNYVSNSNTNSATSNVREQVKRKRSTAVKGSRRKSGGLMIPDADKLPTNKDLQEVQSTVPNNSNNNGVKVPATP